jgi:protein phosphatase
MLLQQTTLEIEDQTQINGGFQGKLLLVADGMGGQVAGDRASALAVRTVTNYVLNTMPWFFRLDSQHEDDLKEELAAALERCQAVVRADSYDRPERRGMGTTVTMAYLLWPRLYVVHAGDSRCYLLRGDELRQLTTDHSMAQQLVDQGTMAPEEAEESRWAHVLYKAIVADRSSKSSKLSPDVYKARLQGDDTLLLCTDGLTKHVPDEVIAASLASTEPVDRVCRRLVEAANADGGTDNTTVVVARFRLDEARGS